MGRGNVMSGTRSLDQKSDQHQTDGRFNGLINVAHINQCVLELFKKGG